MDAVKKTTGSSAFRYLYYFVCLSRITCDMAGDN